LDQPAHLLGGEVGVGSARVDQFRPMKVLIALLEVEMRVDLVECQNAVSASRNPTANWLD